jgi:hypothetical protein
VVDVAVGGDWRAEHESTALSPGPMVVLGKQRFPQNVGRPGAG